MRMVIVALCLLAAVPAFGQNWRYPVRLDGGMGLIDESGDRVGDQVWQQVRAFSGNRGAARSEGRWGYIDAEGAWAITPRYLGADNFEGDRARVRTSDGWMLIDREGAEVSATYEDLSPLGSGLAAFQADAETTRRGRPGQWGILSVETGRELVAPQYDGAGRPAEGVVPVQRYRKLLFLRLERRAGYVNADGDWIVRPEFVTARPFSDGLGMASDGNMAVFLNAAGDTVLTADHPVVHPFSEGRARVGSSGGIGFMDRTGAVVITPEFLAAQDFSGGLAAARKDGKWGYIDPNGQEVIPFVFGVAEPFRGPLTRVVRGDLEQYVTKTGRVVWPK